MAKAKNSVDGTVEKLAKIADELQKLHQGKTMVVFEMDAEQYENAAKQMKVKENQRVQSTASFRCHFVVQWF